MNTSLESTEVEQKPNTGLFVFIMAIVFSLSPLAVDMYLPALPAMAIYFGSSIDAMEASVAVYLLAFALGQFCFGAIVDSVDKRKILVVGLMGYASASIFIGLSDSEISLYIWRGVQAFSAGTSVVVYALVHQKYSTKQSSQIVSYILSVVIIAPMVAPLIGGQILVSFSWNMIFYLLGVYALIAFIVLQAALLYSPELLPKSETKSINLADLKHGYRQIFSNTKILCYVLAGSFAFAGLFAFLSGSPFVYIEYFGVHPEDFGWFVALNALAMVSVNMINAKLLGNVDPTLKLIMGGILLGAVSIYLLLVAYLDLGLWFIVAGVVMYVGCLGLTAANAIAGAMANAKEYAGMVSGVYGVLQFGLGAVASTVVSISASTSAMTMNATMAVCGVISFAFVLVLLKINTR